MEKKKTVLENKGTQGKFCWEQGSTPPRPLFLVKEFTCFVLTFRLLRNTDVHVMSLGPVWLCKID